MMFEFSRLTGWMFTKTSNEYPSKLRIDFFTFNENQRRLICSTPVGTPLYRVFHFHLEICGYDILSFNLKYKKVGEITKTEPNGWFVSI